MSHLISAKRRKIIMDANAEEFGDVQRRDRISDLPPEVLHNILTFLPMKEAVRTSALSSRWRYVWSSIPQLSVDERAFAGSPGDKETNKKGGKQQKRYGFVEFTDLLLLLHDGPIVTFRATATSRRCNGPVSRWMAALSRNGVQNLLIQLGTKVLKWEVPSSLFSCSQLKYLMLSHCTMRLPGWFTGFASLQTLIIHGAAFRNAGDLSSLVSSCPELETLDVRRFNGCGSLEIRAPNLKMLCIRGAFQDLQLTTPELLYAYVYQDGNHGGKHDATKEKKLPSILRLFDSIPTIQRLSMGGTFIKNLAVRFAPENLPTALCHLKKLYFSFDLAATEETNLALGILRSVPNVQEIELTIRATKEAAAPAMPLLWGGDLFRSVEVMKVNCSPQSEPALDLVKLVLSTAPVLSKMVITDTDDKRKAEPGDAEAFESLMQFPRASKEAEVVLKKGCPHAFLPTVPQIDRIGPFEEAEQKLMGLH